ncbi:MAG: DUF502 domain-containing protein [Candidatus Brocadiaceae bacterium]|nr:DUF502 domain-containing protein [Candidatus Brocadiaceae bacterium]
MNVKRHGAVLLNGFIVVAPIIVTVYVVWKTLWWLDTTVRAGLTRLSWGGPPPGIGIVIGLGAIYAVGLLAKLWIFGGLIRLGEKLIDRIPLVKSLYSAVRDLLQFLGGTQAQSRGKSAVLRSKDGRIELLGIITQEKPERFLPGQEGKVAVYLPMSYQLGGYTVFVPKDLVEELPGVSVEEMMKLTLTAGVGGSAVRKTAATDQPRGDG